MRTIVYKAKGENGLEDVQVTCTRFQVTTPFGPCIIFGLSSAQIQADHMPFHQLRVTVAYTSVADIQKCPTCIGSWAQARQP